jgi:PAS domain S-box-containing protein
MPSEMKGRLVQELLGGEWDTPQFCVWLNEWQQRALRRKTASTDGPPVDVEMDLRVPRGGVRTIRVHASLLDASAESASLLLTLEDVTVRRLAERALQPGKQQFPGFFDLGMIGMAITSPSKGCLEVNDEFCRILGYEREELMRMSWAEITHPDDLPADLAQFERVLAREIDGYTLEKRFFRKYGRVVDTTISVKCLRRDDGSVDCFFALLQDVTQRKLAERALRESEERLQLAVFATHLGIFERDIRTGVAYWSPRLREIVGWNEDESASLPAYVALTHPEEREATVAAIERALDPAGDGMYLVEHRIVRRNGSVRWIRVCGHTFFEQKASARCPVRTIGTLEDVTERKEAELAYRLAEDARSRLAAIVDSAEDAIISRSVGGRITSWNAGAERLLGYSAQEMIGNSIELIQPVECRDEEPRFLARILRGESIKHHETLCLHRSGRRIDVALSMSALRDSAGAVIGCAKIMHDISDRKTLEKEVLEIATREQRRIGQELHDTAGQELTALSLLTEALLKALERRESPESMIAGKIAAGLRRALGQMRDIARGLVPVEVDSQGLSAALGDLAARIAEASGTKCTLRCGRTPVEVNDNQTATHLFHIAQEAVTNALRHGKASEIVLVLVENEQSITLRIDDNGVGFPLALSETKGMGLKIMRYRAGLIKARLNIGPAIPVGSAVVCTLSKGKFHEQKHA